MKPPSGTVPPFRSTPHRERSPDSARRPRLAPALRAALLLLVALLAGLPMAAAPMPSEWLARWRSDLEFLATELPAQHPRFDDRESRAALETGLATLGERLPELDHPHAVFELARIVAAIGDGHTRLTLPLAPGSDFVQGHTDTQPPATPDLVFHQLPLRLEIDDRGPWIRAVAEPAPKEILGGSLVAVAGRPIEEVIEAVSPAIHRDNPQQLLQNLPMFLTLAEVLYAGGVAPDPSAVALTVETRAGTTVEVDLQPLAAGAAPRWTDVLDGAPRAPYALRRPEARFWMSEVGEGRLLYLRLREVYDEPEETIREFTTRWTARVAEGRFERLVLDLRGNLGGDSSTAAPLLHGLIASPLNRRGSLFVLIDRGTFSAAMMLAEQLEEHTEAIFVGEATGSRPNHYGDARKIRLPGTGLTVRASTLWHQSDPRDDRQWITPELPAPLSREDWMAGRDPAVEAVATLAEPAGDPLLRPAVWSGELRAGSGAYEASLRIEERSGEWVGRWSLPADGLEDHPVEALEIDGARLTFEITGLTARPLRFSGTLLGERIFGTLDLGSARVHFWLGR